jgi:hypothetical protein
MGIKAKDDLAEVVKAFRRAAKDLGCLQSEQRFQDTLFAIGRHKPAKETSHRDGSRRLDRKA